jgi:hypothetical protein
MIKKLVVRFVVAACVLIVCRGGAAGGIINCVQSDVSASLNADLRADSRQSSGVTTISPHDSEVTPVVPEEVVAGDRYLSSKEFTLALLVTLMLLVSLTLQFALLRNISGLRAEDTLRIFGLTLVITGTVFFIVAGFDSQQIAPAIGLFGTIAGYILGKSDRRGNGRHE